MPRRMSCSLTLDAVIERRKTVTRRALGTWRTLHAGDHIVLVEKAMGLHRGEQQVVLAYVEIVSVTDVPLRSITDDEIAREGFDPAEWTTEGWADWWCEQHGYGPGDDPWVRRIEWRYV